MARAAYEQTIDSDGTNIFDQSSDGDGAYTIEVACVSGSDALVNVPLLHLSEEFVRIRPGYSKLFRLSSKLRTVFVKGNGGNTVVDWAVLAGDGTE